MRADISIENKYYSKNGKECARVLEISVPCSSLEDWNTLKGFIKGAIEAYHDWQINGDE